MYRFAFSPQTFRFTPLYRVSRQQPRFLFIIEAKRVSKRIFKISYVFIII